jgi:catechol 2,3-dioxygenase-like lactoylglutathione lyase family enzyme
MLRDVAITPYVPVADLNRARAFYERTLGFAPIEESDGGIMYGSGAHSRFFMYMSAGAGTSKASTAFWEVKDLEAEMADLRRRGVVFEEYDMPGVKTVNGIATGGGAKAAWFKDTEGNILAITQRL